MAIGRETRVDWSVWMRGWGLALGGCYGRGLPRWFGDRSGQCHRRSMTSQAGR